MERDADMKQRGALSRRRFLVASAGGAAALGIGGVFWKFHGDSHRAWIEQVVRKNLPGVAIDEASLAAFIREMSASELLKPRTHRLAVFAYGTVPWITTRIPKARDGLEKLERRVLTEYLLGSNFFRVGDPKRETIVYYGPAVACGNPFVTFT